MYLEAKETGHEGGQERLINQFARPGLKTLADLIEEIRCDKDLTPHRRNSEIKNIETVCRWIGVAPSELIAHQGNLRPRFAQLSPGGLGISTKRFQNVRAMLLASLRRYGAGDGQPFKVPPTHEWKALMRKVESRYHRCKLRCIVTFASARGVKPCNVDDAFMTDLLAALEADRLHGCPRTVHKNAARIWNRLSGTIEGWPLQRLTEPNYSRTKTPNVAMSPQLAKAIETYLTLKSTDDPFEHNAPMDPWKPSTVRTYRYALRRYFGLLVSVGFEPGALNSLRDLVPIDRVKTALRLMVDQNGGAGRAGASHIARVISQIAVWNAGADADLDDAEKQAALANAKAIRDLADRLHRHDQTLVQKYRERLTPLRDDSNLARLFLLPFALAKQIEDVTAPNRIEALLMQWAMALSILTFCPLRISSLCDLRVDQHLVWTGGDMKGDLTLQFRRRELKGDTPEVLPLPRECAALVRRYIQVHRPVLQTGASPFLFPGSFEDRAKGSDCLAAQLKTLIFKRAGLKVNVHLYRHLVHLVVLSRLPGAYAMISRVLTHKSLETTKRNYTYFDVELSMRAYHDMVRGVQTKRSERASASRVAYDIDREAMRNA